MSDDMAVQILAQASENIQKLFELSTRIDERVKSIQAKQDSSDHRLDEVLHQHIALMQKIAVLESKEEDGSVMVSQLSGCEKQVVELDKRISKLENENGHHLDRWKGIASFAVQLVWVVLAAYILTKFNLQPPAVP